MPYKIMKPYDYQEDKLALPSIAEPKVDGMRGVYSGTEGTFYSGEYNRIMGLRKLEKAIQKVVPRGLAFELDGELTVPGHDFETACGLLRNHQPVPVARYTVFDLPRWDGPLIERRRYLDKMCMSIKRLSPGVLISSIPWTTVRDKKQLNFWHTCHLREGYEGTMVKVIQSTYVRKKSWAWMRMKPLLTVDATIVGFIEGTGKHAGRLGALVLRDDDGKRFKVGTGFTDAQRDVIWRHRKGYSGRVTESVYQRRTNTGSYRHPRHSRFRPDKN